MMRKLITGLVLAGGLSSAALAQELTIEITNLTNGIYYTPLLVSAHNQDADVFEPGEMASENLQAMAEGGDISGLVADLEAAGANIAIDPANGLLAPGVTATAHLSTRNHNRYLSIVAMLLPTNDGFVGMDSVRIPRRSGTYTYYLNGYDAGTEANNEIINGGGAPNVPGIPGDPGGNSGTAATGVTDSEHNTLIHIHRGVIGDMDLSGGVSDLNAAVHHWHNPVAKVVVKVNKRRNRDK